MTEIAAAGDFDPAELARRLRRLDGEELQEFLVLVDERRRAIAGFSGEGTLSVGVRKPDLLTRVTATITTSWRVERAEQAPTVPAPGDATAVKSPAVAALCNYLRKVSPQDNAQFLATLEAVIRAVLVVWLVTGPTGAASDILNAVQRALGDVASTVEEYVEVEDDTDGASRTE